MSENVRSIPRTHWLGIEPIDAWFFRDGRHYTHKEADQSAAESLFPPSPRTLSGAIRAAWARANGWNEGRTWPESLRPIVGDGPDNLGALCCLGPLLHHADKGPLFPAPLHLRGHAESEGAMTIFSPRVLLRPAEQLVETDCGSIHLLETHLHERGLKPPEGWWITHRGLQAVLTGNLPDKTAFVPQDALWAMEPRIGLSRDTNTHTTDESALYSPSLVRLHRGVSLLFGLSGLPEPIHLPEIFPVGGESRQASAQFLTEAGLLSDAVLDRETRRAVLLVLTPLVLPVSEGVVEWPKPSRPWTPLGQWRIASGCLGKPIMIGGWNSMARPPEPLPLRPCLAPGSVLFIERQGMADAPISKHLRLGDFTPHGFGLCLFGEWPGDSTSPHIIGS